MAAAQRREGMGLECDTLDAEAHLIAAMLHQVVVDVRSPRADRREEAWRFLADPQGLRWWDEALGMNGSLLRMMTTVLREKKGAC